MRSLIVVCAFSFFLTACGIKLPQNYYEKSLKEPVYLQNRKDNYRLQQDSKTTISKIWLGNKNRTNRKLLSDTQYKNLDLKDQPDRPYLTVVANGDTTVITNRQVDFQDVANFRDIGGIKTFDGKTVKWGMIFRSDNLSKLRTDEFDKFSDLNIGTVYDLRTGNEIKGKKDHLPKSTRYLHTPTVKDNGDLLTQLRKKVLNGEITEEESIRLTLKLYQDNVSENLPAVKNLLHQVLFSETPVLYHCSAGKDRTGIVTALILSILHVDKQTIFDEYLLSNFYRREKIEKMLGKAKLAKIIKPHLNLKVIENFMRVDARYLMATFDFIDQNYGGMDAFIKNELQIDKKTQTLLIEKFTYQHF